MKLHSRLATLTLPVVAAPMFLVSTPRLVIAQCKAGVIGSMPALNARPAEQLDDWLAEIVEALAAHDRAHPDAKAAPFAVNQIVHKSNARLEQDMAVCARHQVPIIITSLGARADVNDMAHAWGGIVLHDVINNLFARKAIEKGADGLIAVAAGAGGHAGTRSPFALVQELRAWFDGPIGLSGAISTGDGVLATLALGADFAYVGSAFIATDEAAASDAYKQAIVDGSSDDIVYSPFFTGVSGNYLKSSIRAAGLDPEQLPARQGGPGLASGADKKVWRDVWGAGQGIGGVTRVQPAHELVARLAREYRAARERLGRDGGLNAFPRSPMNTELSPELLEFRREVRAFIQARLPAEIRDRLRRGLPPRRRDTVQWQRILNERGWAAPNWPREHGGAGLGIAEQLLLINELAMASAPQPLVFNISMLGPVLIRFGTEAQKRELLPKLANLDLWFCQGFSEPGAGSDLASLRTSATRDGDSYVIQGQKIWTTGAHLADRMFALVRTERLPRKQDGISFLLIDLEAPGITVRPIYTLDGMHHVNEVFFENVRIPATDIVGEEGQGWKIAKYLLEHERTTIVNVGQCRERLAHARVLAQGIDLGGQPLIDDAGLQLELALLDAEVRALEISTWRFLTRVDEAPSSFASLLKLKGVDLYQQIMAVLARIAGPDGIERIPLEGANPSEWQAPLIPRYFHSRAASIAGGSSEVQREVIAKLTLG